MQENGILTYNQVDKDKIWTISKRLSKLSYSIGKVCWSVILENFESKFGSINSLFLNGLKTRPLIKLVLILSFLEN